MNKKIIITGVLTFIFATFFYFDTFAVYADDDPNTLNKVPIEFPCKEKINGQWYTVGQGGSCNESPNRKCIANPCRDDL